MLLFKIWITGVFLYLTIKTLMIKDLKPYAPKNTKTLLFLSSLIWFISIFVDIVLYPELKKAKEQLIIEKLKIPYKLF